MPSSSRSAAQQSSGDRPDLALDELTAARREIEQLRHALHSRILIEQGKGFLAATAGISIDAAFQALRKFSRDHNQQLRQVCADLVNGTLEERDDLMALAQHTPRPPRLKKPPPPPPTTIQLP